MVAESATGIHISKIIRDNILTPLNLDSTFYDVEEAVLGTIANRWYNNVDFHDTSRVALNSVSGGAGTIFSTSSEMAQWYNALFSGEILNSNSLAELTNFIDIKSAFTYGLGLQQQSFFGHNTWGHGGRTWGYKSRMVYDPATGAVVCGLTNSDPSGVDGVTLLLYKVLVDNLPAVAGAITGEQNICQGQNQVTYTVPQILNANSYIWTLPNGATGTSTNNSINVNYGLTAVSGNIIVKGTNSFGDGKTSSLFVKVNPIYNFNETKTICEGDTIYWHGNNYWKTGINTANYNTINGCDSNYTLNLIVSPAFNFSENHNICKGKSYTWHGTEYFDSGIYKAEYTSNSGCDSNYTLNLTVNPTYIDEKEITICKGETYNWQGLDYSKSGNYQVKYSSNTGCDSIFYLNLIVDTIPTGVNLNGIIATADAISDAYQWLDCDNQYQPISGANNQSFSPDKSGNYAVQLTKNNCKDTSDCVQITISDVENLFAYKKDILISPNPAGNFIEITIREAHENSEIKIFNTFGECLINYNQGLKIDVSQLPIGLYILKIGNSTEKFVVVR